jgi:hypothetical protein
MITTCCPPTWEHVGVIASAEKMLDVGGLGPENHSLGGLENLNSAARYPIKPKKIANGSPFPK